MLHTFSSLTVLQMGPSSLFMLTGQIPYTQLIVPALLVAGWFVGCAVMVYVIFS
ncbi:sarcoplasmic/endoplasmic reticulum calcium ATPase regulator DWORF isoform X1 [Ambystoma mexicanum]|uniref:sarcoplasmic/endoplasmic reticulum calcium ATPase regulator DWORF isoform X1 n=1 Tax=Ambystoma mexicanum TaxID=8296 RepID=UPI0037E9AAC4